jgi:hypothetical protein
MGRLESAFQGSRRWASIYVVEQVLQLDHSCEEELASFDERGRSDATPKGLLVTTTVEVNHSSRMHESLAAQLTHPRRT